MKKLFLPLAALALTGLMGCDADIDSVQPSRQVIASTTVSSLPRLDRYIQQAFAKKYNVDIAYRYDDKVTDRRYLLAPVKEEKALEYLNLIDYMFFQVYEASTPRGLSTDPHDQVSEPPSAPRATPSTAVWLVQLHKE